MLDDPKPSIVEVAVWIGIAALLFYGYRGWVLESAHWWVPFLFTGIILIPCCCFIFAGEGDDNESDDSEDL